jgi:uncharacterized protein YggE
MRPRHALPFQLPFAALVVVLGIAAGLSPRALHAAQDELVESLRTLTAPVNMRPGLVVTVAVVTHGRTAGEASQRNAERMIPLLAALRRQPLPDGALLAGGQAVAREDEWLSDGTGRAPRDAVVHTEYAARHVVRITLADLSALGALLDTALAAGATEVTRVELAAPTDLESRRQALGTAVAAARERAESVVGGNRLLGRVVEVGLLVRLLSCR